MSASFRFLNVLLLTVVSGVVLRLPAQTPNNSASVRYQTAKLVEIQKMVRRDPRMWEHDIPVIFTEVETYRMRLQSDGGTYTVEYTPQVQPGYFPTAWVPGGEIEVRMEGRKMFLKAAGNVEVSSQIVTRK